MRTGFPQGKPGSKTRSGLRQLYIQCVEKET